MDRCGCGEHDILPATGLNQPRSRAYCLCGPAIPTRTCAPAWQAGPSTNDCRDHPAPTLESPSELTSSTETDDDPEDPEEEPHYDGKIKCTGPDRPKRVWVWRFSRDLQVERVPHGRNTPLKSTSRWGPADFHSGRAGDRGNPLFPGRGDEFREEGVAGRPNVRVRSGCCM